MKILGALACLLACATVCPNARADDGALAWSYRYVLITARTDSQLLPVIEDIMVTPRLRDRTMCDLLAELLVTLQAQKISAKRTAFDIARILTNGPDGPRYRDVLAGAKRFVKEPGAREVFQQYAVLNRGVQAPQYIPGTIDIDGLRREFIRSALATQPTMVQAQALADLPTNATFDQMVTAAGKPALVAVHLIRVRDVISVEVRRLWFYYRGIGRVTFDYQRESGWHIYDFTADPMAFETWMPYRTEPGVPDDTAIAMIQLLSGNPSAIKVSAQAMYRRDAAPLEYLDTAAEMLAQRYVQIANSASTDAFAWLCNVLAHQGGRRYAALLANVERTTIDPKLKRFAAQGIDRGHGIPTAPYVVGSVSLDAQAQKYPTLYPQITLIRGFL